MSRTEAIDRFISHLGLTPSDEAWRAVQAQVIVLLDEARASWPQIEPGPELFLDYIAARLPPKGEASERLQSVRWSDLYLAAACARADAGALQAFSARILARLRPKLRQVTGSDDAAADVVQSLAVRLLTCAPGEEPRIVDYRGMGSLQSWVRVAAVRQAFANGDSERRLGEIAGAAATESALLTAEDPELRYLKERYEGPFLRAIEGALASLNVEERNLLRFYQIERLSIGEIGKLYKVHRATVARWIADCREQLLARTRTGLTAALQISESEADSIIGLLRSRLDVSLRQHLRE